MSICNFAVRLIAAAAALTATGASLAGAAPEAAEYAIRWDPAKGGPVSAQAAFTALGLKPAGDTQTFVVRYYTVPQPAGAPPGSTAVARERSSGSSSDATYKLRGSAPFPNGFVRDWKCPLAGKAERKHEVDIGWIDGADAATPMPRRAYSVSCTADAPASRAFRAPLGAVPALCTSRMERLRRGDVKAEQWTLPDGRRILEVSLGNAKDSPAALERFRQRIALPLLGQGLTPLRDSKTELGSAC